MFSIILTELFFLTITSIDAFKDANAYLLKAHDNGQVVTINKRVRNWHTAGFILYFAYIIPFYLIDKNWEVIIAVLLIRYTFFDYFFNIFAGLNIRSFGTSASSDNFNTRIFKKNGVLKKLYWSIAILIILNILKYVIE